MECTSRCAARTADIFTTQSGVGWGVDLILKSGMLFLFKQLNVRNFFFLEAPLYLSHFHHRNIYIYRSLFIDYN